MDFSFLAIAFNIKSELYTLVTNCNVCTRNQSLVAVVAGTKAEDVIAVLLRIDGERCNAVEEVTPDCRMPCARLYGLRSESQPCHRRFYIRELACEAVQELRIWYAGCYTAGRR